MSGADVSAQDFSAISIVIFSDDFNDNVIDPIKWTDITGYSVTEANEIMKIEQGAIDNGGNLWSGWIDINPDNVLTIYRKVYLQYYWQFQSLS